jgi:hypothetical protein
VVPAADAQVRQAKNVSIVKVGIVVIAVLGVGGVFVLAIVDGVLGAQDHLTVGDRLVNWTKRNPWFAGAASFILGVLISHFFWPGD